MHSEKFEFESSKYFTRKYFDSMKHFFLNNITPF